MKVLTVVGLIFILGIQLMLMLIERSIIQQLKEAYCIQAFRVDIKFESASAFDFNLGFFIFVLSTMFSQVTLKFNP